MRREARNDFQQRLRSYVVRTRREDAKLPFPKRHVQTIPVELTPGEQQLWQLVTSCLGNLNALQQTSVAQALMSSPQALVEQLKNMAIRGSLPQAVAEDAAKFASAIDVTGKMQRLLGLIAELRSKKPSNWRVVVFTLRTETQNTLGHAFRAQRIPYGFIRGSQPSQNVAAIQAFKSDPPGINVIVSTDAGAEGINLQAANVLVNFDLPWNPMVLEQRIGRIQRLGSPHENVTIYNLVTKESVEEHVVARLLEKLEAIAHALGDIEAILEVMDADGDDESGSFESRLRELVILSLQGRNVDKASQQILESIEHARQQLRAQEQELNDAIGRLDELHRAGPKTPRLERKEPAVSSQEFVMRALKVEGASIERISEAVYCERRPGRAPEYFTFDEAHEGFVGSGALRGHAVKVYSPGKPAFERLAQHWVENAAVYLRDGLPQSAAAAEHVARKWCEGHADVAFVSARFEATAKHFQGQVLIRAKTYNGVDSYEKLITGNVLPKGHDCIRPAELDSRSIVDQDLTPSALLPTVKEAVDLVAGADRDLNSFCEFYEERLREESDRAGGDQRRIAKITSDLRPLLHADVAGMAGATYASGRVTIQLEVEGKQYVVALEAIPLTRQILHAPAWSRCSVSGKVVPESCLAPCSITGTVALRHRLVESEDTGRLALPEHVTECQVTGRRILADEVAASCVSGKLALKTLLAASPVSNKLALPEEFVRCEVTGTAVLPEEIAISDVSGRGYRIDQQAKSSVSGRTGHQAEFAASPVSGRLGTLEEFAACEFTDVRLLLDEVATSELSGRVYRLDQQAQSSVSGKRGHRSEFVTCAKTSHHLTSDEAGKSSLSGLLVRKDLLSQSELNPERWGLQEEMIRCAATGRLLLRDEAVQSPVSKQWFGLDQTSPSAVSGRRAHAGELVRCEKTGMLMLPAEAARCAFSGLLVDRRLLQKSMASNRLALPEYLVACEETGQRVLPDETSKCEETGHRVVNSLLAICEVTGKRVLKDRLTQSAASKKVFLARLAERSVFSNQVAAPGELVLCHWLLGGILPAESRTCALTGLTFTRAALNPNGELTPLRNLLDGAAKGSHNAELDNWMRQQRALTSLGRIGSVESIASKDGRARAVVVEVRSMFGLVVRYAGCLVVDKGERELVGRVCLGQRTKRGWVGQ